MSDPEQQYEDETDPQLSLATSKELVDELKRRHPNGMVFAAIGQSEDGAPGTGGLSLSTWLGPPPACYGLVAWLRRRLEAKLRRWINEDDESE